MIKAIIFDWGRTLYDKDNKKLFDDSLYVIKKLYLKYPLGIVSIASDDDIEKRFKLLDKLKLRKYFKFAFFHTTDKDSMLRNAFGNLNVNPKEILVIDDVMRRLELPIKAGCKTIWIQRGKFANETPNKKTGNPTHAVKTLREIIELI